MCNLVCLFQMDPDLALESFLKLSKSEQLVILGTLVKESGLNPNSDVAALYLMLTKDNYTNIMEV